MNGVSVFMDAEAAAFLRIMDAEKNKDPQRQAPAISGQIGNDAVLKYFPPSPEAAEEQKQTGKIDRQSPGKLQQKEKQPGPARSGNRPAAMIPRLIHIQRPFHYSNRIAHLFPKSE
ncbi:MAG: hypothetical protein HDT15_03595 [Oscillibacter sp.]|nr:hypothetical protein [Oscillibacter sp.]